MHDVDDPANVGTSSDIPPPRPSLRVLPPAYPPGLASGRQTPRQIREIQRRRGEAVYGGGLRPQFRRDDGTFDDPDDGDLIAYHLVQTHHDGVVVGGHRAAPLEALSDSSVRRFNAIQAERLLTSLGLDDNDVLELGRLWMAPAWRGTGLGVELLLAGAAVGRILQRRLIWGTVGERHGLGLVISAGWHVRPEFGRQEAPELADTLRVVTYDPQTQTHMRQRIDILMSTLGAQLNG
jgi:GNAT superfamily N-acetyltransferase